MAFSAALARRPQVSPQTTVGRRNSFSESLEVVRQSHHQVPIEQKWRTVEALPTIHDSEQPAVFQTRPASKCSKVDPEDAEPGNTPHNAPSSSYSVQAQLFLERLQALTINHVGSDELDEETARASATMVRAINLAAACGVVGFGLVGYSCELEWSHRKELWADDTSASWYSTVVLLKTFSLLLSFVILGALCRFHFKKCELYMVKHPLAKDGAPLEGLRTILAYQCLRNSFLLDVALLIPQPMPGYETQFEVTCGLYGQVCKYELDMLLVLTMTLGRAILVWRFVFARSIFWPRQSVMQRAYQPLSIGPWLFLSHYHNKNALRMHTLSLVIFLTIWSFVHSLFDRAAEDFSDQATINALEVKPIMYRNYIWMHIVTATTVGYGEYVTHTYPGRFCLVVTICMGAIFFGLIMSAIGQAMQLHPDEADLLEIVQRKQRQEMTRLEAVRTIQRIWRAKQRAGKRHYEGSQKDRYIDVHCTNAVEKFKALRRENLDESSGEADLSAITEKVLIMAHKLNIWQNKKTADLQLLQEREDYLMDRQDQIHGQMEKLEGDLDRLVSVLQRIAGLDMATHF